MPSSATSTFHTKLQNPFYQRLWVIIWLVVVGGTVGVFILSLPLQYEIFRDSPRYAGGYEQALAQIGMSAEVFALYFAVWDTIQAGIVTLFAGFVFWRRRDDWLVLFASAVVLLSSISTIPAVSYALKDIALVIFSLSTVGTTILLFVFPDGHFVPRWTRWLSVFTLSAGIFGLSMVAVNPEFGTQLIGLQTLFQLLGITMQIYRYRNVSTKLQRQQTKWVILGFFLAMMGGLVFIGAPMVFPELTTPSFDTSQSDYSVASLWWMLASVSIIVIALSCIPVTFMLSIARYRLWDVDLTINRSIVTLGVTATLVLVFAGVFVLGQAALRPIVGAANESVALIVGGVVMGAAFNPVRMRVRRVVDRRLYGLRFDLNQLQRNQSPKAIANPGFYTGRVVDDYTLLDVLGRGAMGEVYLAEDAAGQQVAIKLLMNDILEKTELHLRFFREAQAMQSLQHPHIVQTYQAGENDGLHYIALEYIDGQTLKDYLMVHGRLSWEGTLDIVRGLAIALDTAHGQGLVHRDLKPSNIMLRLLPDGETYEAVLLDFGIAKIVGGTAITGSGAVGTIGYMAPEQIVSSATVDHRADLYALGVLTYEMLTGQAPFSGNPAQVMFAHIQQPPPDPCALQMDIPIHVGDAILQALSKSANDRPQSARDFLQACGVAV